ncbi:MAG TPA: aquaporin [Dehalococcoidia bacterium]|nr:aquaporin [Dehalococcoidia bacterium]
MAAQTGMSLGFEDLTSPTVLKAAFAELIVTMFFVLVSVGAYAAFLVAGGQNTSFSDGIPMMALASGLTFGLLVASIVGISGGHINPAVTFGFMITGQINLVRGVLFIVAQVIGAILGALLLRALILDDVVKAIPGGGGLVINSAVVKQSYQGMILEALGTFVLVWTYFGVAISNRSNQGVTAALYIGLAVVVATMFLLPFTGGGLNPARELGPALALPKVAQGLPGRFHDWWVYWVGPILGASVAGLTYYVLYIMSEPEEA